MRDLNADLRNLQSLMHLANEIDRISDETGCIFRAETEEAITDLQAALRNEIKECTGALESQKKDIEDTYTYGIDTNTDLREKDRLAGETTPEEDKLLSQAIKNAVQGVM